MGRLEVFHTFDRFTNPPADALADRLVELAPMPDARVFLPPGVRNPSRPQSNWPASPKGTPVTPSAPWS